MRPNLQETGDLVTFNEETINGKHHFCAVPVFCFKSMIYGSCWGTLKKNKWNMKNEIFFQVFPTLTMEIPKKNPLIHHMKDINDGW